MTSAQNKPELSKTQPSVLQKYNKKKKMLLLLQTGFFSFAQILFTEKVPEKHFQFLLFFCPAEYKLVTSKGWGGQNTLQ